MAASATPRNPAGKLRVTDIKAEPRFDRVIVRFSLERASGEPFVPASATAGDAPRIAALESRKRLEAERTRVLESSRLRFEVDSSSNTSFAVLGSMFTNTWAKADGAFVQNEDNEEGFRFASVRFGGAGKKRDPVAQADARWPAGREVAVNRFAFEARGLAPASHYSVRVRCFTGEAENEAVSDYVSVAFVTTASAEADAAAEVARGKAAAERRRESRETAERVSAAKRAAAAAASATTGPPAAGGAAASAGEAAGGDGGAEGEGTPVFPDNQLADEGGAASAEAE